jgi:hypothetical protein
MAFDDFVSRLEIEQVPKDAFQQPILSALLVAARSAHLGEDSACITQTFGAACEIMPNIWDKSPMRSEGMDRQHHPAVRPVRACSAGRYLVHRCIDEQSGYPVAAHGGPAGGATGAGGTDDLGLIIVVPVVCRPLSAFDKTDLQGDRDTVPGDHQAPICIPARFDKRVLYRWCSLSVSPWPSRRRNKRHVSSQPKPSFCSFLLLYVVRGSAGG